MLLPSSEGIAQYLEAQESFVKVLRSINNVAAAASDDTPWASFVVFVDFMFKTNASIHSDNSFSWTTSFVFEMKKHSTFQNKQRDLGRDLIIFHQFTEGNSAQFRKPLGYNGRKKNINIRFIFKATEFMIVRLVCLAVCFSSLFPFFSSFYF